MPGSWWKKILLFEEVGIYEWVEFDTGPNKNPDVADFNMIS